MIKEQRERCTCCDKVLNPDTSVSLELDTRSGHYFAEGQTRPLDFKSQGWFSFGETCAKKEIAQTVVFLKHSPCQH